MYWLLTLTIFVAIVATNSNCIKSKKSQKQQQKDGKKPNSLKIHGGTPSNYDPVGHVISDVGLCTAFVIQNRCLLTAAHCIKGNFFSWTNDLVVGQTSRFTYGIRTAKRVADAVPTEARVYKELGVVWMANNWCMSTTDNDCNTNVMWTSMQTDYAHPSAGTSMKIVGYGANAWDYTAGKPIGHDTQREGNVKQRANFVHATVGEGSYIEVEQDPLHFACNGDSGGPMIRNGKAIGVIAQSYSPDCENVWGVDETTRVTSFLNGNGTWVDQQVAAICKPKVGLDVAIAPDSSAGNILGVSSQGAPVINCGMNQSDCSTGGVQDHSINITITAGESYHFKKWERVDPKIACPCQEEDATEPDCSIDVNDYHMAWQKAHESGGAFLEQVKCKAVFELNTPSPPPLPTTPATPPTPPGPT